MSLGTKRIHVLGLGNLGCFFAHSLRQANKEIPISLLFHRESLYQDWDDAFRRISVTTTDEFINTSWYQNTHPRSSSSLSLSQANDPVASSSSVYDIESSFSMNDERSPIYNLILATKSFKTLDALSSIKHRLSNQSSILFVQNGLGIIPEVNRVLFPNHLTRPSYLVALVSHGLYSSGPFKSVHAGPGRVLFGHLSESPPESSIIREEILAASILNASYFDHVDLHNFQMEKLVVNAVINPLSAIFHCANGKLFWIGTRRILVRKLMRRLISEINQVFLHLDGPEGPLDPDRYTIGNMELMVTGIARKTRNNLSSMLQDILHHRETEIDSINGWIVAKGEEKGIDVKVNKKLIELVKSREKLIEDQIEIHFPGTITSEEMNAWSQSLENLRRNGVKNTKKFVHNNKGMYIEAW